MWQTAFYTQQVIIINSYVQVQDADEAIRTRTHEIRFNNTPVDHLLIMYKYPHGHGKHCRISTSMMTNRNKINISTSI